MLARTARRVRAPHPFSLDVQSGSLARRRPHPHWGSVRRGDSAAEYPYFSEYRRRHEPVDRHLQSAARRFLRKTRLGPERRRLPHAGTSLMDELIRDTVDLHYHSAPSPFPRRMDPVEAAHHFDEHGFKAVVLKSHHHNTVMDVLT